jgi:hypothetical protein
MTAARRKQIADWVGTRLDSVPMPPEPEEGERGTTHNTSGATRQLDRARAQRYGSAEAFSEAMGRRPDRVCKSSACDRVLVRREGEAWGEFFARECCSRPCSSAYRYERARKAVAQAGGDQ